MKEAFVTLEGELKKAKADLLTATQEWQSVLSLCVEKKMRLQALLRLKEEFEGLSHSSKIILKEKKATLLSEAFDLNQDERLVQALRPYTQTLLVPSDKELEEVLEFAKAKQLKELSFFSLSRLKENQSLEEYFLSQVIFKESFQVEEGVATFVKDLGLVDSLGVLFYGVSGENRVFLRQKELQTLKSSLKELEEKESHLQEREAQCKQIQEGVVREKGEIEGQLKSVERALFQEEIDLKRLNLDIQGSKKEDSLKSELNILEEEEALVRSSLLEKERDLKALLEEIVFFEEEEKQKESLLIKQKGVVLEKREELKLIDLDFQQKQAQILKLKHEKEVVRLKQEELKRLKERLEFEIKESEGKLTLFQDNQVQFQNSLETLEKRFLQVTFLLKEKEEEVSKKKENLKNFEKEIEAIKEEGERLSQSFREQDRERVLLSVRLEALEKQYLERFEKRLIDDPVDPLKISLATAERKVLELNRKLQEAGEINFTAIVAFDEQKERALFLKTQMYDLTSSKEELTAIISELEGRSKKAFKETFEAIRTHFQTNFQTLFQGGFADLTLVDTEKGVLEAGIDIIARPPGKQTQSIQLLSGGEKCLTAMALLFAIFSVKPAPFCILDEIDAPLDDSNVLRLNRLIQEFQKNSQFIIITHNKVTMKQADRLFGVSMEERGVSKILTVSFKKETIEVLV